MRIALLAHNLRVAGGASVGRNLISAIVNRTPQNEYFITYPLGAGYENTICERNQRLTCSGLQANCGVLRRLGFEHRLRRELNDFRPDWTVGLGNLVPPKTAGRSAVLVQDAHFVYPTRYFGRLPIHYRMLFRARQAHLALRLPRADLVCCQTPIMAARLRQTFALKRNPTILPNGISNDLHNAVTPAHRDTIVSTVVQFLYVSRYYAHKGFEMLLDALCNNGCDVGGITIKLTIDPQQCRATRALQKKVVSKGLSDVVKFIGAQPQRSLGVLYSSADAVVIPSTLESFSASYLEAMHFGVPIIASNLDFVKAICGDACLYFDPWSTASIANAMKQIRDDVSLRRALAERGTARLRSIGHSWPTTAQVLLDAMAGSM